HTLPQETPPEVAAQMQPMLEQLKGALGGFVAAGMATEDSNLGQIKAGMQQQADAVKAQLAEMGIDQAVIDAADSTLLSGRLAELDGEIKQAEFLGKQMEATVRELKKTYSKLEAAKMQATAELAAASVQIDDAEKQLESGIEQFEDARDTALKQANIDSLVTQEMLSNILMAQNFSMPAGYITDGSNELTVKVGEAFATLEELENLLLVDMGIDGVKPIYLKDVADIAIADNSGDSYVRINGNPGVTLSIQKSSTASTSKVSDLVTEEVEEIMAEDSGVHVTQLMDQGMFIDMVVNSVMNNMLYGGIIALIVLIFFLQDIKPTIIIGFSIPLSVLFAIVMMYFSGVNLNVMSLSGLALGIGMLVDNSIVVIENVYRLRSLGYSRVKAAVVGAKQVSGSIASSTLTTICVFLPIVFTDGLTRQLFTDMGLTIAYSLVASLVVALTVVPAMASIMLKKTKNTSEGFFGRITTAYEKLLAWSLDRKWLVIVFTVGLLVFCGWRASQMPMTLIPAMDSTQMEMNLAMPRETPDEELIRHAEIIAERVNEIEDIQTVGITIGSGGMSSLMGSSDTKNASFYIVLNEEKKLSNEEIADIIEEKTPEYTDTLNITANTMDLGALAGSGLSVQIKGNDLDMLQSEAKRMAEVLKGIEGVDTVNDGSSEATEELRIEVDKKKAMEKGLTVAQVFAKVSEALTEETTATTLTFEGTDMDAIIHAATTYNRDNIGSLVVTTETDDDGNEKKIRLRDIASTGTATTPESIGRANQSRYVTVTASISEGYNATLVSRDVQDALEGYEMPKGYSYEMTGEDEMVMTAMIDMIKMIALAIVFIYLIMVAQFQSLKSPFIVMFTIPLAFTGGLLALLITGTELSLVAMIGFLVLAGIVVNNGIVFVDYVNQLRLEGVDKRTALIQTGRDRIRPILMTALTTILANSTMAMGVGMGAELSQGMAMVSIGGLAYATLLTLFLVPALYDIFNRGEIYTIDVDFEDEGL
ncbi:MAG: efflux RND transporter permease subunit, partial [Oscillospiraceae bacterium]|nr:efflux RND transporter permease subunit [Oscillospiraceae bacterium]